MKRNVEASIAAALLIATAGAQAADVLVAGEFVSENVIVETRSGTAAGGGSYDEMWTEEYPFPRHYGPID